MAEPAARTTRIPYCDPQHCPRAGCDPVVCVGAGLPSNGALFRLSLIHI